MSDTQIHEIREKYNKMRKYTRLSKTEMSKWLGNNYPDMTFLEDAHVYWTVDDSPNSRAFKSYHFLNKKDKIIIELDSPDVFFIMESGRPAPQQQQNNALFKMQKAINQNYKMIRLFCIDVIEGNNEWANALKLAISDTTKRKLFCINTDIKIVNDVYENWNQSYKNNDECAKLEDFFKIQTKRTEDTHVILTPTTSTSPLKHLLDTVLKDFEFVPEFDAEWSENKRYDFGSKKYKTVIESDGIEHFMYLPSFKNNISDTIRNDRLKNSLAINNGYTIIRVVQAEISKNPNSTFSQLVNILKQIKNKKISNAFLWIATPNTHADIIYSQQSDDIIPEEPQIASSLENYGKKVGGVQQRLPKKVKHVLFDTQHEPISNDKIVAIAETLQTSASDTHNVSHTHSKRTNCKELCDALYNTLLLKFPNCEFKRPFMIPQLKSKRFTVGSKILKIAIAIDNAFFNDFERNTSEDTRKTEFEKEITLLNSGYRTLRIYYKNLENIDICIKEIEDFIKSSKKHSYMKCDLEEFNTIYEEYSTLLENKTSK